MIDAPVWQDLVARGRELVAADRCETRFELGDLALVAEPMGKAHAHTGSQERLDEFAEEIGTTFQLLRDVRLIAVAWPEEWRHTSASFEVHRVFRAEPDRAELIRSREWTVREARATMADRHPKAAPPRRDAWWRAQQDAVRGLRGFDAETRLVHVSRAEAGKRAALLRELVELAEPVIDALEFRATRSRI